MKQFLLFILFPFILFGQTQLGNDIDGEAAEDRSGRSVSLSSDGSIVAIGAPFNDGNGVDSGHVRVYNFNGSIWTQLGSDIDGEAANDDSGRSVSLSSDGSIVAIGAEANDGNGSLSGHVRVYSFNGSSWMQLGSDIDGGTVDEQSGWSVSLSSDGITVAIGASFNSGNVSLSGQVRIYTFNGSIWTQLGSDIDGEAANDQSGFSVSLSSDGGTVAIGAPFNDGNGSNSGHVRVYNFNGTNWIQFGSNIDGEMSGDISGFSVSLSSDGSKVAIGAPSNDGNGGSSGHIRVYSFNGANWIQLGGDIDGETANDRSGRSVSLSSDGTKVAIGAFTNAGNGLNSGQVRIYTFNGGVWTQLGSDIDGEAAGDQSGEYISLSSDSSTVAIGSAFNDDNGSNSGHVRVYSLGAVLSSDSYVLSQFNLYPNPVKEQFTIQLDQGLVLQKLKIFNNIGQLISTSRKNVVNTYNLPNGLYFIKIETNKGEATKKIIKQ